MIQAFFRTGLYYDSIISGEQKDSTAVLQKGWVVCSFFTVYILAFEIQQGPWLNVTCID